MRTARIASVIAVALLGGVWASPVGAEDGDSQYCGVVDSSGDHSTVATGYVYADGQCFPINDPANYVCLTDGGQLPTRTETISQTINQRTEVVYTFREVVWRVVPDYSSYKRSGPREYISTGGSSGYWQGADPTAEEQAAWDGRFMPELIQIFNPGEPVSAPPTDNDRRHLRDREVNVPGPYEEVTVDVEVEYTGLVRNGAGGACAPVGALPEYDLQMADPTPPVETTCINTQADTDNGTNCQDHFDHIEHQAEPGGGISTHLANEPDPSELAQAHVIHSCMNNGGTMITDTTCGVPHPAPTEPQPEPQTTTTTPPPTTITQPPEPEPESGSMIYTCPVWDYTYTRVSDHHPLVETKVRRPDLDYQSLDPCG